MQTPVDKFQKVLRENNLKVFLPPQKIRYISDGAVIIENPELQVDWINPPIPDPEPTPTNDENKS